MLVFNTFHIINFSEVKWNYMCYYIYKSLKNLYIFVSMRTLIWHMGVVLNSQFPNFSHPFTM